MFLFVVPTLTATFVELGVELPTSTKIVIGISDFLRYNLLMSLVGIVTFVAAMVSFFKSKSGRKIFDWVVLRIPVIGPLIKETYAARTTTTLSSLLSSGVEVVKALEITERVLQNVYYKEVLRELEKKIQKGTPMSKIFGDHEDLYPPFVIEMTLVGEETGELSELLGQVGAFYESDVQQKTEDLSTIIEPALMMVIGAGVGFFVLSMLSPMYSLMDSL